jgi:hypothetical protein
MELSDPAYPKVLVERETYRPTKFTYEEKKEIKPKAVVTTTDLVVADEANSQNQIVEDPKPPASTESTAQLNVLNPKKKKRATLIAVTGNVQSNLVPTYHDTMPTQTESAKPATMTEVQSTVTSNGITG